MTVIVTHPLSLLLIGFLAGNAFGRWDTRHPFRWWLRRIHWRHLAAHWLRARPETCRFCRWAAEDRGDPAPAQ